MIILLLQSKASLDVVRIVSPPLHHDGTRRAKEDEDEQQVGVEPGVQRRTANISPLVPKCPSVSVKVEVEERPDEKRGKGPGAKVSVKGGGAGEEDCRVPEVKPGLGEFLVQQPNDNGRYRTGREAIQYRLEER